MKRVIGIDLGTTNCCIAWMEGKKVVVYEEEGRSTIPSIVAQDQSGEILAGWRAKTCQDPLYRHGFAKRDLGSSRKFQLKDKDNETIDAVWISATLLKELKARAEAALKSEVAAVITIPAHFEEIHRKQTQQAAQKAGLELIELLREPVAAAIAYYHEKASGNADLPREETILVYDLGGGTMDATVCVRHGQHIEVGAFGRAFEGDKFLGGVDFDKALVGLAAKQLEGQGFESGAIGEQLPASQWLWELMTSAESCKHRLSDEEETPWHRELVSHDSKRRATLNLWLSREKFEQAIKRLVDKTLDCCDQALLHYARKLPAAKQVRDKQELLRLAVGKLDRIILVGGSTLVPCIRRRVHEHYKQITGREPEIVRYRPFECVAIGAAIYAERVGPKPEKSDQPSDQIIHWISGPEDQGEEVKDHPPLVGKAPACNESGWEIEMKIGDETKTGAQPRREKIQTDGQFFLPAFPMTVGENQLEFSVFDSQRNLRGRKSQTILRGGMTVSPMGLAHPIYMRLVDGEQVLIPAGPLSSDSKEIELRTNDESGTARAPLYEGHSPAGEIVFPANVKKDTKVIFHLAYSPGKLDVEIRVGQEPPVRREVDFVLTPTRERGKLQELFDNLIGKADFLLAELPQEGALANELRREWETLQMDIKTEFANPIVLDPNRIEDRIRQVELLQSHLQAFSTTAEGLRQRAKETRGWLDELRKHENVDELEKKLDEIEAEIKDDQHPEVLATLAEQLRGVRFDLFMLHPPEINKEINELISDKEQQLRGRLQDIRRNAEGDQASRQEADEVEAKINTLLASGNDSRVIFYRLLVIEKEHVNELYRKVVIRKSQQGLLRSAK